MSLKATPLSEVIEKAAAGLFGEPLKSLRYLEGNFELYDFGGPRFTWNDQLYLLVLRVCRSRHTNRLFTDLTVTPTRPGFAIWSPDLPNLEIPVTQLELKLSSISDGDVRVFHSQVHFAIPGNWVSVTPEFAVSVAAVVDPDTTYVAATEEQETLIFLTGQVLSLAEKSLELERLRATVQHPSRSTKLRDLMDLTAELSRAVMSRCGLSKLELEFLVALAHRGYWDANDISRTREHLETALSVSH